MNTPRKFWFILIGAILTMVIIACSCGTITTPTAPPSPTALPPPNVPPSPTGRPMPELEGYWQWSNKVYTIAWQNSQYVVTSVIDSEEGSLEITSQSWNGSTLTWTYYRPSGDTSETYTTSSVSGNKLFLNYSNSAGYSSSETFHKVSSAQPSYDSLPLYDDFSDPNSGWAIWEDADGAVGYSNGSYFSVSKTHSLYFDGYPFMFFGDTVIEVDVTAASGPGNNYFGYAVACRVRNNGGSYSFEIDGQGYYAVGVFTDSDTYISLLSGDEWQYSSAITPGLATNHLIVTCAGSLLRLEVNGQVVFEGQDSTYPDGDIGLSAITYDDTNFPAEVHFDNLVVTAP